jgi:hypothetical protein
VLWTTAVPVTLVLIVEEDTVVMIMVVVVSVNVTWNVTGKFGIVKLQT